MPRAGVPPGDNGDVRFLKKLWAYARIMPKARRNRTDLAGHLIRRPQLGYAVTTYESMLFASNRVDTGVKALAMLKASSRIGCPF